MVGPPLSGAGEAGRGCAAGRVSGGAAGSTCTAGASGAIGVAPWVRASAMKIGVAQGLAAGVEWRWHGGRSDCEPD
jgi:hypothetical protein